MGDEAESVVYEEAIRGMDRQQSVVEGLRSRSGSLSGAASLVTAFLGGQALSRDPELDLTAWIAILAFVTVFGLSLLILWPWKFRFVLDPMILIEDHLEKTEADLHVYLATIWGRNYVLNEVLVNRLHTAFRFASLALLLEVIAWLIKLGGG